MADESNLETGDSAPALRFVRPEFAQPFIQAGEDATLRTRFPDTFEALRTDTGLNSLRPEMSGVVQSAVIGTLKGDSQSVHSFLNGLSAVDGTSAQVMARAYERALARAGIKVSVAEDVTAEDVPSQTSRNEPTNRREYGAIFEQGDRKLDFFRGDTRMSIYNLGRGWRTNANHDSRQQFGDLISQSVLNTSLAQDNIYKR